MNIIISIIFGIAITIIVYETVQERKQKMIHKLLAPKIQELIEASSLKIFQKQKELNRELTDDEKNKIFNECYNKM